MEISPNFTDDDWRKLDFQKEEDWQDGIEMLQDRVQGRFLVPIRKVQKLVYSGFAVMALECLLIETLEQFRKGEPETPYHQSEQYFKDFLTNTSFSKDFTIEKAKMFYKQIRCGILHQAEIKENSKIRTDYPDLVTFSEDRRGLLINRNLFHDKLEKVFYNYLSELRNPSNEKLRKNFRKKMDHICRVSRGSDSIND